MSQIINFSNYSPQKDTHVKSASSEMAEYIPQNIDISADEFKLNVNILVHNHPNKINFTVGEVATYFNKGPEFIRRRIKSGQIVAKYFGDSPMISISELARLLTEGIK